MEFNWHSIKTIAHILMIQNNQDGAVYYFEKEFNKLLPLGDFSPSDLGYNKPLIYFGTIPFWAFNCISKLSRNITVDDKELYKLLYNELKDKDQFVEYLNKEIFKYIQAEIRKAKDLEAWDRDNMWYEPNKRFVKWFQIKNIDPNSKVLKKDETNDALWAIADDMRQRKEKGEFDTYMDAYRWAEKNISKKGVSRFGSIGRSQVDILVGH